MSSKPPQIKKRVAKKSTDLPIGKLEKDKDYVILTSKVLTQSVINGIRRCIVSHVKTIGFEEYVDPKDFRIINEFFKVHITNQRHTVLVNNTKNAIPMLAHRLSRLPIFTSTETRSLLFPDTAKIFFTLSDPYDYTKPYFNENAQDVIVHSRDLVPVALKRVTVEDSEVEEYEYDEDMVSLIKENIKVIFPYNVYITNIPHGCKIHAIVKPILGSGIQNCRWSPCTQRYRFNRDPRWGIDAKINLRKEEGKPDIRKQFSLIPDSVCKELGIPIGSTYDRFNKPYEIELLVAYNGKMNAYGALLNGIDILRNAVIKFQTIYNNVKVDSDQEDEDDDVENVKDEEQSSIIYKEQKGDTQHLYMPFNINDDVDVEDLIFTGHTMGNLLSSKMLQIVDRDIIGEKNLNLYENVFITYKVPHHLIKQCLINIQLPVGNEHFKSIIGEYENEHAGLVNKACDELIKDLQALKDL